MFTHRQTGEPHEVQHLFTGQIEGDFQFSQDHVVVETLFFLYRRSFFFSPSFTDQPVEKICQLGIAAILPGRILVFFQQATHLLPTEVIIGEFKKGYHLAVAKIKGIAKAS